MQKWGQALAKAEAAYGVDRLEIHAAGEAATGRRVLLEGAGAGGSARPCKRALVLGVRVAFWDDGSRTDHVDLLTRPAEGKAK